MATEDDHDQRERQFNSLYQANYRPVQAYAVRRLGPSDDAADIVAEVFTTAWRRLADIPPPPGDRLWLYGVARRVIAGRHRSARRLRGLFARLAASHRIEARRPAWAPDAVHDNLLAALCRLRPAEREALQLVLWEQLSHAEAAKVLGCSVNAVGIRVHRAKARLRDELAPASESASADPAGHGAASGPAHPIPVFIEPNGS